jgi:hypothetical protein
MYCGLIGHKLGFLVFPDHERRKRNLDLPIHCVRSQHPMPKAEGEVTVGTA